MNYIKQVVALSYHDEDERIVHFARIDINYKLFVQKVNLFTLVIM